jgi:hypothetical protein
MAGRLLPEIYITWEGNETAELHYLADEEDIGAEPAEARLQSTIGDSNDVLVQLVAVDQTSS